MNDKLKTFLPLGLFFGIGIIVLIGVIVQNNQKYAVTDSELFSIDFPGKPVRHSVTGGTSDAPFTKLTYSYQFEDTGPVGDFRITEYSYQGEIDEAALKELFSNSVNFYLNQNSDIDKYTETVLSTSRGITEGYPSIDATLKINDLDIYAHERFILVGHRIYWIKSSFTGKEPNHLDKYINSFKLKLPKESI